MTHNKTPSELGLNDEDLLDFEKSSIYWQQFTPEEFILEMVSFIKETITGVSMWTFLLTQNPKKASTKIIDTDTSEITIADACSAIESNQTRAKRFLELSSNYTREHKKNHPPK